MINRCFYMSEAEELGRYRGCTNDTSVTKFSKFPTCLDAFKQSATNGQDYFIQPYN